MHNQMVSGQEERPARASLRAYYLDWLRVLAILTVFVYHTSRLFNMEDWSVKNATWYPGVEVWNQFATTWMLPLIFVISGASLFHAVGKGAGGIKGAINFIKDKALRLLVPVVVCDLTHGSLQAYLDRVTHGEFSGSYLEYLPNWFLKDFSWEGAHLWYLWLLFLFSVLLYPLMRWLLGRGRNVLSRLGDLLAPSGAVYALALPSILLAVLLDYENVPHNAGWNFLVYLWLTLTGFLIVSDDRVLANIRRLRWLSLPVGLALTGLFLAALLIVIVIQGKTVAYGTPLYALGWGLRAPASWFCILAILGFGMQRLNFSTPFLKYANEAVLPFYILHQTVIMGIAYFVVQWAIPDLLKWVIVVLVSFAIIMALYEFLVRRYNVMRFLFGMKPLRRVAPIAARPAQPAPEKA